MFEKLCRILSEELLAKEQINFSGFKTSSPRTTGLESIGKKTRPHPTCSSASMG